MTTDPQPEYTLYRPPAHIAHIMQCGRSMSSEIRGIKRMFKCPCGKRFSARRWSAVVESPSGK